MMKQSNAGNKTVDLNVTRNLHRQIVEFGTESNIFGRIGFKLHLEKTAIEGQIMNNSTLHRGKSYHKSIGHKFQSYRIFRMVSLLLLAMALPSLPAPAQAEITLKFGVYLTDKPTVVVRKFRPILAILESALSIDHGEPVKIKTKVSTTYNDGIKDLVEGRVDFSRFGPASYLTVKAKNPGVTILAMETKNGGKVFHGIIAVHRDSPIHSISHNEIESATQDDCAAGANVLLRAITDRADAV